MDANNTITVIDEGHERRYYATIPNLIDDLELSPYAVRLYLRLKRRAGEAGICFENTGNLAKGCKMSAGMITKAKNELVKAGLIRIEERPKTHGLKNGHNIFIVDIWTRNLQQYSPGEYMNVHHMNMQYSPGEIKKNPIKESQNNKNGHVKPASLYSHEKTSCELTGKDHPAIKATKQVTGYYPKKNLWPRIIKVIGENPDLPKLQEVFDTWTANGHNPMNLKGWLFDWYQEGMYYLHPSQKLTCNNEAQASPPAQLEPEQHCEGLKIDSDY